MKAILMFLGGWFCRENGLNWGCVLQLLFAITQYYKVNLYGVGKTSMDTAVWHGPFAENV